MSNTYPTRIVKAYQTHQAFRVVTMQPQIKDGSMRYLLIGSGFALGLLIIVITIIVFTAGYTKNQTGECEVRVEELADIFTVVPNMSRDDCMEQLCILNFWTRPGLFSGETWEFESPYGEGVVLNFDSRDVLYLVSTGVRMDEDNRIRANTPRPLISRLKLRWFMEKEKAISVMLSTGLFNGHPVREAGKYAVFSFSDVDVKLAFSDENLFTGIQLSDQEWEKMIE